MLRAFLIRLFLVGIVSFVTGDAQHHGPPQGGGGAGGNSVLGTLDHFGYENIGGQKYAAFIIGLGTWLHASQGCKSHHPDATLFTVENAADSNWLGARTNLEKDRLTGSAKFWVGLTSSHGQLQWLNGASYHNYPEVVQVSGHDDASKIYAWAVPDSLTRIKYEFLTRDDEAEAYICQYILQNQPQTHPQPHPETQHQQTPFVPQHQQIPPPHQQTPFVPQHQQTQHQPQSPHQQQPQTHQQVPPQFPQQPQQPQKEVNSVLGTLNHHGYKNIGGQKYAAVIIGLGTWNQADRGCKLHHPDATLFIVSNTADSNWLGERTNLEKDSWTGSSKFWVGLTSSHGQLKWLNGAGYLNYPEVVQVSGHDDASKIYAWAVPDSLTKIKYEFLTRYDEADAYICQYVF